MQFSISEVVRQSCALTAKHWIRSYALGILPLGLMIGGGVLAGYLMAAKPENVMNLSVAVLVMIALSVPLSVIVFNYWIRFGALGAENGWHQSVGSFLKATLINGIKLVFIILILILAVVIIYAGLSLLGLDVMSDGPVDLPPDAGLMTILAAVLESESGMNSMGEIASQILVVTASCIIYSFFSANLTGTAIGNDGEGFEHPHTLEFGIALLLIDLAFMMPVLLLALAGQLLVAVLLQYLLLCPAMAAVSIAHGVRYRMCAQAAEGEAAVVNA